MVGLVTCKNEENLSENEGTRVVTTYLPLQVYKDFPRCSRAANSYVPGRILPNSEQIRDFMGFLVACKNKEIKSKMKALEWSQHYSLIFQTVKGS